MREKIEIYKFCSGKVLFCYATNNPLIAEIKFHKISKILKFRNFKVVSTYATWKSDVDDLCG